METHFASPERSGAEELQLLFEVTTHDPVVEKLLQLTGSLVAILNEHRQVLSVNRLMLESLGLDNDHDLLGLRPGEVLGCDLVAKAPSGCGTGISCASCGAAISIVLCQRTDTSHGRKCTIRRPDGTESCFRVLAAPLKIKGRSFVLLFMNDISKQEKNARINDLFLHDISNIVSVIAAMSQCLIIENAEDPELITSLQRQIIRLAQEIQLHKMILQQEEYSYEPQLLTHRLDELLNSLLETMQRHPASKNKSIMFPAIEPGLRVRTDSTVLNRILTNLLLNALEASSDGDAIELRFHKNPETLHFEVHNPALIPEEMRERVFQCYFSTKDGSGRGFGTYSVKLLTEKVLDGQVSFRSEKGEGTTFMLDIPLVL